MQDLFHPFQSQEKKEAFLSYYKMHASAWPVDSKTRLVASTYGATYVRVSGPVDGPPIVLLHGDAENGLSWIPQIETLSKKNRVYVIDNIYDNGMSIFTKPLKNKDDFVQWLDELFYAMGLEEGINLIGFSYGGWLASIYALAQYKRLNKLVLISPASTVLPPRPIYLVNAIMTHFMPTRFLIKRQVKWERSGLLHEGAYGQRIIDQIVHELILSGNCFKRRGFVTPTVLSDEEWRTIQLPILFLVGEKEVIYSASKAVMRLRKLLPEVHTVIAPGASHDITYSQSKLVNKEISSFLDGASV